MSNTRPVRPVGDENLEDLRRWYPEVRDPPADGTFEIALVIAGGQSAGAYSAGVLDYLFEALDRWHAARANDPDLPRHTVKVKVFVGASAGGLNAALASIAARYRFDPARDRRIEGKDDNASSPFYAAWVRDIDVTFLLAEDESGANDGHGGGASGAMSLLNAGYLKEKVQDYVNFRGDGIADPDVRAWLEDPLPAIITVSNLDGVPYDVRFTSASADDNRGTAHRMTMHRDHVAFQREIFRAMPTPCPPDREGLQLENKSDATAWQALGDAALATIAIPALLEGSVICRPNTDYDYRFAFFEKQETPVFATAFPGEPRQTVSFPAVDGGVMNNEPFAIAHGVLAGSKGVNPRGGEEAKRAIVLIDPFVDPPARPDPTPPWTVVGLLVRLFKAFKAQSGFKQIDLALAQSNEIYSRFMVAPVRRSGDRRLYGDKALASRPLMGLFGFFSEHYRHHDFMLGRENCYRFLRDWFVLPSETGGPVESGNKLFDGWSGVALADPAFKSQSEHRAGYRQVIPLVESGNGWPEAPEWPAGKFAGFDSIRTPLKKRLSAYYPNLREFVLGALTSGGVSGFLLGIALDLYWIFCGRTSVLRLVEKEVNAATRSIDEG